MMDETANRADETFYAAVEMAPPERQTYLDQVCADDPLLRAKVEEMLSRYSKADHFFQESQLGIDMAQFLSANRTESGRFRA